jgi:D-xylose 1-dehydrogenase (NADP+, D-xylono-1,5-lactone-forming)
MAGPKRWGFIGAGENAQESLAPAVHGADHAVLQAVASRDLERARLLRPAGRCYTRYGDLLDDPDVDAVYVGLSNEAHLEWTLAAARSGRSVLCEKPLALSARGVDAMIDAGRDCGVVITEACWDLWHPRIRAIQNLLRDGAVGRPCRLTARFCSPLSGRGYRFVPERGGGAVYDLACYVVSSAMWAFMASASEVRGEWSIGETGVDLAARATLSFLAGVAEVEVGFSEGGQELTIEGDLGRIIVCGDPFTGSGGALELIQDDRRRVIECDAANTYQVMIEEVSLAFRGGGGWVPSLTESRACAAIVDAWRTAAERQAPILVATGDQPERRPACAQRS